MKQKVRDHLRGLIRDCCGEARVLQFSEVMVAVEQKYLPSLEEFSTKQLLDYIRNKIPSIHDIYNQVELEGLFLRKLYETWFRRTDLLGIFPDCTRQQVEYCNVDVGIRLFPGNDGPLGEHGIADIGRFRDFVSNSIVVDIGNELAEWLINELEKPGKTCGVLQLPSLTLPGRIFEITDDIVLFDDLNPEDGFGEPALEDKGTHILVQQLGSLTPLAGEGGPLVYKNILNKLKTFLGLSLIWGVFEGSHQNKNVFAMFTHPQDKRKKEVRVQVSIFDLDEKGESDSGGMHTKGDDLVQSESKKQSNQKDQLQLPQAFADLVSGLSLSRGSTTPSFGLIEEEKIRPLPQFEGLDTPEAYLRKNFEPVIKCLSSNDQYAERIRTASLWYLEGVCADNDTFKFVNYTIAIEALLGPREKSGKHKPSVPLTESLADRCGFSLGRSLEEKENIRNFFKKDVYDTRSRIVHGSKIALTESDYVTLEHLEKMTRDAIRDAMGML